MPPGRGKVLIFVAIMLAWAVIMVFFTRCATRVSACVRVCARC